MYRYWNSILGDHFYTTNSNEIGTTIPGETKKGYKSEGIQCLIFKTQVPDSQPLLRYWNEDIGDHFYTLSASEIGTTVLGEVGKFGYKFEGTAGYCFPKGEAGNSPLFRYYKNQTHDHFYTTNSNEIGTTVSGETGNHGYTSEGIVCYVPPEPGKILMPRFIKTIPMNFILIK